MQKRYHHQKLIRDKIPEIIKSCGGEFETRILDADEFEKELKKKLVEETREVISASDNELSKELADVLELIKSIADHYQIDFTDIEKKQKDRREKRGGFSKRIFLIWSTGKAGEG